MKKKYDADKYEVSDDMPERFAQVIPGLGVQHFSKANLTDNDLKALTKAKNQYVKKLKKNDEDKLETKDIGAGLYPG